MKAVDFIQKIVLQGEEYEKILQKVATEVVQVSGLTPFKSKEATEMRNVFYAMGLLISKMAATLEETSSFIPTEDLYHAFISIVHQDEELFLNNKKLLSDFLASNLSLLAATCASDFLDFKAREDKLHKSQYN